MYSSHAWLKCKIFNLEKCSELTAKNLHHLSKMLSTRLIFAFNSLIGIVMNSNFRCFFSKLTNFYSKV